MENLIIDDVGLDLRVHCYDGSYCYCSNDNSVYRYDIRSGCVSRIFTLPCSKKNAIGYLKNWLARSWLRRKFFPGSSFDNLIVLSGGGLLVVFDQIYCFSRIDGVDAIRIVECDAKPAFAPPLRGGVAEHPISKYVYFGEYVNGPIDVIRVIRVDVATWSASVCWSFDRSDIKHIHAIHYDRFRNRLWILTGDLDRESAFYYTDDEFLNVHRFAGGDQTWRAIAILFDEAGMEWGTDAGKDAPNGTVNKIFRYDFRSGKRWELASIDNPVYGAHDFDDGTALMQTAYEGGVQGQTERIASLWYRDRDRKWQKIYSLPFKFCPRPGEGGYGQILIPNGVGCAGHVLCMPVNTEKFNYRLIRLQIAGGNS